jgi:hypothetical protein
VRRTGLASPLLAASLLIAACGSGSVTSPAASSAAASAAGASVALTSPPADGSPSATASPAAPTPIVAPSGASVTLDPSLLGALPASVGGVAITQEPESFAEALKDPGFVASVDRAVFAIAVDGSDLVSGVVAHLRPGVYSDRFYGDWRATYDQGACASAGGVVAHAESTLGTRTVYVTTCGGGLRVYHTYLPSQGVIFSLFSTGPANFGEQLMAGIKG